MYPVLPPNIAQELVRMRTHPDRSKSTAADPLVLADGRRVKIRPIERHDRDRLRRLFMRLTPESRYRRYLSPKPTLSERELDHLLDVDHVHHEALAAVDQTDGSFVAAARYVQLPDQPDVADVAIEVADDLHKQGIGVALAIRTLDRARANGFTRVTATTLRDNRPARALLQRLHFRPRSSHGYEAEFELELTPDVAALTSASTRGDPVHPKQPTTRDERGRSSSRQPQRREYPVTAQAIGPAIAPAADAVNISAGERVIDVATGTGNTALLAAARGVHVLGIDTEPALLAWQANAPPPNWTSDGSRVTPTPSP
jgi:RimJ/RimL family protein N-acetyltransferase